jgi:DNA-binding IclR family transcriptional regulator
VAVLDHARHPLAGVAVTFPCAAGQAAPVVAPSLVAEVARTARAITARIGG